MEMLNCAVLNQHATRDYRMFQILEFKEPLIKELVEMAFECSILKGIKERYLYEEWFASKAIFLAAVIPELHKDHSKPSQA